MKKMQLILFSLLFGILASNAIAQNRYYPANSIRCTNVLEQETDEYDPINREYKKKYTYYHYYTGNDTIVDGSPCVMLWKYSSEAPQAKELRFVREVEGVVSMKMPLPEGGYSDWIVMFEFPYDGWVKGEKYIDGWYNGEIAHCTAFLSTGNLLNGENVQILCLVLMYGIGYNDWPFFEPRDFAEKSDIRPYNYYRNDVLLWGEQALKYEKFFPAYGIRCTNSVTSLGSNEDTIYYNFYTGGDTIVDGKECVQLWEYCTDTPEKLTQHLLHETGGKVYIRRSSDNEWRMLYDFALPQWSAGDNIAYAPDESTSTIESVDAVTLLNGDMRQVANLEDGSRLIYGLGYADEPFFGLFNCYGFDNGEKYNPINFYYYNKLIWGEELAKKREQRFFPANGIYATTKCTGPSWDHTVEKPIEHRETIYFDTWTGNDTIVDGRECVTIWNNYDNTINFGGVVYEDNNGLVYLNLMKDYNSEWMILYDFTPRIWTGNITLCTNLNGWEEYKIAYNAYPIELCNGESVPYIGVSGELIYGIGYLWAPALSYMESYSADTWTYDLYTFYRNGELLWKAKESDQGNSVTTPNVKDVPTTYYDLQGRPVDTPIRGIYIKDGKKMIIGQ